MAAGYNKDPQSLDRQIIPGKNWEKEFGKEDLGKDLGKNLNKGPAEKSPPKLA